MKENKEAFIVFKKKYLADEIRNKPVIPMLLEDRFCIPRHRWPQYPMVYEYFVLEIQPEVRR